MITEAIATTPARVATRFGAAAEIARLLAPVAIRAAQGRAYRRSLTMERSRARLALNP